MIALNRGRKVAFRLFTVSTVVVLGTLPAQAQFTRPGRATAAPTQPATPPAPAGETPRLQEVRVPTNTTDPIAIVNGEIITRQQLADECVARKGTEILETLIARRLIEQALRRAKMEVTPMEVDQEIDNVAMQTAGVTREEWLRNLDKQRGISPAQYARDVIYPTIALKKLARPRVQVTEQDIKDAFDANYGARMQCRIIICKDVRSANEIWEELRKNPGGFENIAKARSIDTATRALGGMLPDPIARHGYPRHISDPAFAQLVDGDPKDNNPAHKPKDGDFTGPIQMDEKSWVILRREELFPGRAAANLSDPNVRANLQAQMFEVKLTDSVSKMFAELMQASSIDNKLTGQVKMAHEEQDPDFKAGYDQKVELMNNAGKTEAKPPTAGRSTGSPGTAPGTAKKPPAGVPTDAANAAAKLQNTLKNAPTTPAPPPGN